MSRLANKQSRILRKRVTTETIASLLIYTMVFVVVAFIANIFIVPNIADAIYEATVIEHSYIPAEKLGSNNAAVSIGPDEDSFSDESDEDSFSYEDDSNRALYKYNENERVYITPDGSLVVYDTSTYNAFKSLKWPMAIALYLFGCLIILLWQMRKSLRYFDELSTAVAAIVSDKETPIELSSQLYVAQNELNRMRSKALADERATRAAEQRKNELVAYLAHDIRTPLTSILGYLSILKESPELPDSTRIQFTDIAFSKAEHLESLVNEFFEITRYNLQSIPIERQNVDIELFLKQLADEFFPTAQDKDIAINVKVNNPDNASFFVDGDKLARAIGNVIRNAITYADPHTFIEIEATHTEAVNTSNASSGLSDSHCSWHINISNQGKEISPERLENIFEKFYRADDARSASSGGAGLGLAIAKEIITAHKGTISATSANGVTVFTVRIK